MDFRLVAFDRAYVRLTCLKTEWPIRNLSGFSIAPQFLDQAG
jgi:hypothetical protein